MGIRRSGWYLFATGFELVCEYLIGLVLIVLADFLLRMLPELSVLDELTLVGSAYAQVLLSRLILVHIAVFLAAKLLHGLLPGESRLFLAALYLAGAVALPALWGPRSPGSGAAGDGGPVYGFFLIGLPLLVLALSTLFLMPKVDRQIGLRA